MLGSFCNSSEILSHVTSLFMVSLLRSSSWGWLHLCHDENLSLQLNQSPNAWHRCISSHVSHLIVPVDGARALFVGAGTAQFLYWGRSSFLWRANWSSFICARLIASFNVLGLKIRISYEIYGFNPLIKVPTNAFCVEPRTLFSSLLNSYR